MPLSALRLWSLLFFCSTALTGLAADGLRSQAVVDLSFDEAAGNAVDRATHGAVKDRGVFTAGARRVASPFWNQPNGKAAFFNAGRKQYVQVADGADVDRPTGATVSFFFLNLHPAGDAATHGIVAKRDDNPQVRRTNYGINYIMKGDSIRPYINDASGFRFPDYSASAVIGTRRLVYLTATFEVADAPNDADDKPNDVRIRFFANGKQLKPKRGIRAAILGSDAWITGVNVQNLLNDVPLTLGATRPDGEFASCLIDEFTLFDRALTPVEVASLFKEVAGPDGDRLAREELLPAKLAGPQIALLSHYGLQAGAKQRIQIRGGNLSGAPQLRLPFEGVQQQLVAGSNAGVVSLDVTLPPNAAPGFYPFRVQTDAGLSNAAIVAVDRLPQHAAAAATAEQPGPIPAAYSGVISGSQQMRVYFRGKAGQRIVADVESRRLGSSLDPVLEFKNARGTPLAIEWSKIHLRGDARAEVRLPADGLYYVELHDLAYRAPGNSPFRVKVGDLKLVDAWHPATAPPDKTAKLQPVGAGWTANDRADVRAVNSRTNLSAANVSGRFQFDGPAPAVMVSPHTIEVVELAAANENPQSVDAAFAKGEAAVAISGIVSTPGEADVYRLNVTPGKRLRFRLDARAIDSPLDGRLTVRLAPGGAVQVAQDDRGGSRDPMFDYTPPGNAKQIEVVVADLHGRGGKEFRYRLHVEPVGKPDFSLSVTTSQVRVTAGGTTVVQLQVARSGYNGAIKLTVHGVPGVGISPAEIPAGRSGLSFVILTAPPKLSVPSLARIQIVGSSTGKEQLVRTATIKPSGNDRVPAAFADELPMAVGNGVGLSVKLTKRPPAIFKGANTAIGVQVHRGAIAGSQSVRLSLISNEPSRRVDPKKPGNKPRVRSLPGQAVPRDRAARDLKVAVPFDLAAKEIEFVLRADVVPHAFSNRVLGTVYSAPFRLPVKSAGSLSVDAKSLRLAAGATNTIRGTLHRTGGFTAPVQVTLVGLPKGYTTKPFTVAAGATDFAVEVTPPAGSKQVTLAKTALQVRAVDGETLLPNVAAKLAVVPPQKPAAASRP